MCILSQITGSEMAVMKILYGPFTVSQGMDVVFIEEEGIPIELDYFY